MASLARGSVIDTTGPAPLLSIDDEEGGDMGAVLLYAEAGITKVGAEDELVGAD